MYATGSDLIDRYGAEIEQLKTMQENGRFIDNAIQDATEEINAYLGGRYSLPLQNVPSNLKRMACDIARYRLFFQQPTDEVRQRYEDAINFLKLVATNKAHLQIQNEQTNEITSDNIKPKPQAVPVGTTYRGGVFGDDVLNNMPSL